MTLLIWWPRSRWKRIHVFTTLSNEDLTNRQIHGLKGLIVNVPGGFVSSIGKPGRLTTTGSGNTVASNVQVAPLTPPSPTDGFAKCTPSYALKSVGNTSVEMFGMIGTVLFDKRPLEKSSGIQTIGSSCQWMWQAEKNRSYVAHHRCPWCSWVVWTGSVWPIFNSTNITSSAVQVMDRSLGHQSASAVRPDPVHCKTLLPMKELDLVYELNSGTKMLANDLERSTGCKISGSTFPQRRSSCGVCRLIQRVPRSS